MKKIYPIETIIQIMPGLDIWAIYDNGDGTHCTARCDVIALLEIEHSSGEKERRVELMDMDDTGLFELVVRTSNWVGCYRGKREPDQETMRSTVNRPKLAPNQA